MVPRRWEDAAEKWLEERSEKADIRGDKQKLGWLESHFGGKMLHEIDRDLVKSVVELKENNATRNRYVALVRAMVRRYAHLKTKHLLDSSRTIDAVLSSTD